MLVKPVALDFLYLLLLVSTTQASFVNVSVDDTYGDARTGQKPVYQPSAAWDGANCNGCDIVPNIALAFDGTWTAATTDASWSKINITFSFTGVSIWVFFILANVNSFGDGVASNCNFTLDGNPMGSYNHVPDMSTRNLQYNATVFSTGGLSNTEHTLVISTNDYPSATYLNFDYAIYTMDVTDGTTSSNPGFSPTGATQAGGIVGTSGPSATLSNSGYYSPSGTTRGIVGANGTPSAQAGSAQAGSAQAGSAQAGSAQADYNSSHRPSKSGVVIGAVIGVLAFVGVIALLILFRRSRKKRRPSEPIVTTFNQQPPRNYRDDVAMRNSHLPWQGSIYNGSPGSLYDEQSRVRPSSDLSESTLVPVRREPFIQITKSRDELRAVRQMEINQRLQSAEQEMQNLTSRQLIHGSPEIASEPERQETEHEMGSMREQIRELRAQIEQLQAERSSDWALGLSDEPPPAYY